MKVRTFVVLALGIALLGLLSTQAEAGWYTATVNAAGPIGEGSQVQINLTDTSTPPAFQGAYFVALGGRENQMLATAVSAISSGTRVLVFVDSPQVFSTIRALFILSQ